AFMLSAAYAGAAGALCAYASGAATPDTFGLPVMVACLSMAVVGGRNYISGAIVGAVLLVLLPEAIGLGGYAAVLWAAALLIAVIIRPDGIAGAIHRRYAPPRPLTIPQAQAIPPRK